jgi:hypothetical protein
MCTCATFYSGTSRQTPTPSPLHSRLHLPPHAPKADKTDRNAWFEVVGAEIPEAAPQTLHSVSKWPRMPTEPGPPEAAKAVMDPAEVAEIEATPVVLRTHKATTPASPHRDRITPPLPSCRAPARSWTANRRECWPRGSESGWRPSVSSRPPLPMEPRCCVSPVCMEAWDPAHQKSLSDVGSRVMRSHVVEPFAGWVNTKFLRCLSGQCGYCHACHELLVPSEAAFEELVLEAEKVRAQGEEGGRVASGLDCESVTTE